MDPFSTAIHTICFFSGKIHGTVFARIASLWDMSSAIAFSNFLGMKLVDIRTGQEIKTLDLNIVENNWILKHIYLLTKPEHFSEIVKMIEYKE